MTTFYTYPDTTPNYPKTELPKVVKVRRHFFRISAKGFTPAMVQARLPELTASMGYYCWTAKTAFGRRGERLPTAVDISYTTYDLPRMLPLTVY